MGKSTPPAPAAPDYAAAATAQGAANQAGAQQTATLSNPNIISPYGNQTVSYGNTAPVVDQAGYDQAMKNYGSIQDTYDQYGNLQSKGASPTIDQFTKPGSLQPTVTQTLTPDAQAALTAQQKVQAGTANLGLLGLQQATGVLNQPFNYTGPGVQTSLGQQSPLDYGPSPGQYGMAGSINPSAYGQAGGVAAGQYGMAQGGVAGPNLQTSFGGYGNVQNAPTGEQYGQAGGVNAGQYGMAQGPSISGYGQAGGVNAGQYGNLQSGLDLSGVAKMPVNAGVTGQQAIMSRLQPQIDQQAAATTQQLANQGITPGSEAYNNAMRTQGQQQNDLYTQAALQGIGLDTSANQQGYNQALSSAGLYNQALGQGFGQATAAQQLGNQAIGQNVGYGLQANAAQNSAVGQNFGQGLQAQQLGNQSVGQNFGQGMQSNAAQNAAQAQQYNQASNNAQFNNAAQLSQFQSNLANQQAGNQAVGQNYGQGVTSAGLYNTAIGQNYGQALGAQQLGNQAVGQNYGQGATSAGLYNQAGAQNYNQNLGAAQFGNTAAAQYLQQQLGLYNQPLNSINALMSSSQIQNPQFQQYTGANVAAAPVYQATQNQAQAAQDVYGQQMAARNANVSALGGVLGGAAGMISPIKIPGYS